MSSNRSILQRLSKSFDLAQMSQAIDQFVGPLQTKYEQDEDEHVKKDVLQLVKSLDKCQSTLQRLDAALTENSVEPSQLKKAVHDAVIAQQIIVKLIRKINYGRYFEDGEYHQLSSIMVNQTIVESLFIFVYSYADKDDDTSDADDMNTQPVGGDAHV